MSKKGNIYSNAKSKDISIDNKSNKEDNFSTDSIDFLDIDNVKTESIDIVAINHELKDKYLKDDASTNYDKSGCDKYDSKKAFYDDVYNDADDKFDNDDEYDYDNDNDNDNENDIDADNYTDDEYNEDDYDDNEYDDNEYDDDYYDEDNLKTFNNNNKQASKKYIKQDSKQNKKRNKNRDKDKSSLFKRGMFIYITFLILIIFTVIILLWIKLSKYQANFDNSVKEKEYAKEVKHAPQITFQNYLTTITLNEWIDLFKSNTGNNLDTDETIESFIKEKITEAEYSCYRSPNYKSDKPEYVIGNDNEIIATFTLEGNNLNWNVSDVKFSISGNYSTTVEVPDFCDITCNGYSLDDSYIVSSISMDKVDGYENELINPVSYKIYELNGLIKEPSITVSSKFNMKPDNNGRYYREYSEDSTAYKEQANVFIQSLLRYYAEGKSSVSANMASAISHVAPNSEASKVIRASADGVSWCSPTGASYITEASEAYVIADNCFFVDISYKNQNAATVEEQNKIQIYRVFFLDFGSGYKIYSFALI